VDNNERFLLAFHERIKELFLEELGWK
jgi:hypothetical protein